MRFQSFILPLGAFLVLPAWAKTCTFDQEVVTNLPENQEDVDTKLKDCTTILGTFRVSSLYEGSLIVKGVTNMSSYSDFQGSGMTEMVWSDLEVLRSLGIYNSIALHSISFPKLATVGQISIYGSQRLDLDFPVLTYADSISLQSSIASFNAPLLFNVSSHIHVTTVSDLTAQKPILIDAFNFSLPSLEYIGNYIILDTNLSDVVLPKLKVISPPRGLPIEHGLRNGWNPSNILNQFPPHLVPNISLPSLIYAEELSIQYNQSVSLPLLEQVLKLELYPTKSSKVILPSLWKGIKIEIYGKVTDVSFPALNETDIIDVRSSSPTKVNCTSVTSDWERTNTTDRHSFNGSCTWVLEPKRCSQFRCSWVDLNPKRKKTLNGSAIAGISVGVVVILALILVAVLRRRSGEKIKKAKEAAEAREREIEMDGLTINGDTESLARIVVEGEAAGRRDSKDTVVVVEERNVSGQRSG